MTTDELMHVGAKIVACLKYGKPLTRQQKHYLAEAGGITAEMEAEMSPSERKKFHTERDKFCKEVANIWKNEIN
jgi:hypothetical protein